MIERITTDKLVHGGQALGQLSSGKTIFVWGALPAETVDVEVTKNKKTHAEGLVRSVIEASPERVEPRDEAYLSTSPWQILSFAAEHTHKQAILTETMLREGVVLPDSVPFMKSQRQWQYRNKMEYSFWGDEDGLHLALFKRGSRQKNIISGSSIAMPEVDTSAEAMRQMLEQAGVRASQLKNLVVRSSQSGETVAALFVKDEAIPALTLPKGLKGLSVFYSNPKSPASVRTKELKQLGSCDLVDSICGHDISYGVHSFFQVNIGAFEQVITDIQARIDSMPSPIVDMYAGVGALTVPLGAAAMVEIDSQNIEYAHKNVDPKVDIIHASSEDAIEHIPNSGTLVVDPPRAGMHKYMVQSILSARPKSIVYLSCNPSTQARDIARLQEAYTLESLTGYNFFPKTPHIESLALLRLAS